VGIRVVKGGAYIVKDETYDAVVESLEERREDEDKHYLLFFFKLTEPGQYRGMRLSGLVSPILDEGTDLDRWLTAILGRRVEDGEEMDDLEAAVAGRPCRVRTETKTKAGRRYSNVVDVSAAHA